MGLRSSFWIRGCLVVLAGELGVWKVAQRSGAHNPALQGTAGEPVSPCASVGVSVTLREGFAPAALELQPLYAKTTKSLV